MNYLEEMIYSNKFLFRIHHEDFSGLPCSVENCSRTFTCEASLIRHLIRSHSTGDLCRTMKSKERSSSIRRWLSGLTRRQTPLKNKIETLCRFLLNEEDFVNFPECSTEKNETLNESLDEILLEGYREIGLTDL